MLAMTICAMDLKNTHWSVEEFVKCVLSGYGIALKSPVCVSQNSKWRTQQYKELLLPSFCFCFMFLQHT